VDQGRAGEETVTAPVPSPEPPKRSKRFYILWGIALTLLISTALFCWLVVVPVIALRQEVREALGPPPLNPDADAWFASHEPESRIAALGGVGDASRKLGRFLRLPGWIVGNGRSEMDFLDPHYRHRAVSLLTHCGDDGVHELIELMTSENHEIRLAALTGLAVLGGKHHPARRAVERALDDKDEKVRALATDILKSVRLEVNGWKWPKP
jgi:HEAT repeats